MDIAKNTSLDANVDAEEILRAARQDELPAGWTVIPLNTTVVQRSILSWIGGTVVGFGLLALLLVALGGLHLSIGTGIVALILVFLGIGSLWLVIKYARLLADREHHLIVMTPDAYVQQRGAEIVAVPMNNVAHVTLRGVFGGDASYSQSVDERDYRNAVMGIGQMFGGSRSRRARRTPDSLAFVDTRNDAPVIIAEDNSFTELPVLEEMLRTYVENAQRRKH
jgi:hypothetical protein